MLNTPTHLSHFHPKFLSLDETLLEQDNNYSATAATEKHASSPIVIEYIFMFNSLKTVA